MGGLILDAEIRRGSDGRSGLDDVLRILYSRFPPSLVRGRLNPGSFTSQDIFDIANQLAGTDLTPIYDRYVVGTDPIPVDEYLDEFRDWLVGLPPTITAVEESLSSALPADLQLEQNYPNPFNAETVVTYSLPSASRAQLVVYDVVGQRIRILADGWQDAGEHQVRWDSRDETGDDVASGIYMYRLQTAGRSQVRRMVLIR